MRRSLLLCTVGATLLAAMPILSSAGESMARRLAGEVAILTDRGQTEASKGRETEFGRRLLETWKSAGVELPMPEEQIVILNKGQMRLSTKPEVELPENMRFTGFLQYSNVDGKIRLPYGFYTFSQKDGFKRRLYKELQGCLNGGGAYVGNRLYGSSNIQLPVGNDPDYRMRFYQWDTDTWKLMDEPTEDNYDLVAAGADFDPISKNVYGITFGESGKTMLSIMDYEAQAMKEVGDLAPACESISAFAINSEGIGYALDRNADLFKVDLSSASAEKIGSLDFEFYSALQSMTFDPRTGKLYLVASEGDPDYGEMYGRLCEVSLDDASTKLVGYLPEAEEYTVLHVVYDPEADAPGAIEDLTASYADTSMNGVISFTMPHTSFGGTPLSGDMDFAVYTNDDDLPVKTGTAKAGEKVNVDVVASEGRTKFVVVLSNEAGEGERNAIESWGGLDTPATVKAQAEAEGDTVTVTWEAGGANNGFADLDGMTYTVFRFPGPTMVAEGLTGNSFTDNIADEPNGAFVYNVVPVKDGRYYQGLKTNPIYGGAPRDLPYTQDFESDEACYEYLMINNHDKGWEIAADWGLEGVMWYSASPYVDGDSWALTPALAFEEGNTYIIRFNASRINSEHIEYLSIGVGEGYDTANYDTLLERYAVDEVSFNGSDELRLVYECKKTGAYHVGFHALSPRNQSSIVIHDLSVEKGLSVKVPGAVTELKATPGVNGDLYAEISFKAPSVTVGGTELDNISRISLYREGTEGPIAELTDVKPGEDCTITDKDAMNGALTYKVTAWNEFGEGEEVSVSVYVGIDMPTAPSGILVSDNLDGTFTLSWETSPFGVNGGVIDLDELTYNIYYYDDGSIKPLATDVEDTSYTVTGLRRNGQQAFMFLSVSAVNDLGESELTEAPAITIGDPYTVPFMEGFANLEGIWLPEGDTVDWGIYSGMSCDDDDFLIGVRADDDNATGSLRSGKFNVNGVSEPKAVFSFYGIPGIDNTISLSICRDGSSTEQLLSIPFLSLDGPEGWRTCMVDVSRYSDAAYFNLIFEVSINDEDYDFIYIDDINVRDVPDHNLEASVMPQNRVTAGEQARVDVKIHNIGTSTESSYNVEIYVDDALQTSLDGVSLQPFERTTLTYHYPVSAVTSEKCIVKATLVDPNDRIEGDNTSEAEVKVTAPLLESPSNLTVSENGGNICLEWEAPSSASKVTDSFEGYESFVYNGFGDWEVIDGDGMKTMSVLNNFFPGSGKAASFFTVDFSSLGYDLSIHEDFAGHAGESFIACMRPTSLMSDDWIISPELNGEAQTISLFAKSIGAIFSDSFEILYSEKGKDTDDFITTGIVCEPNGSWEEYTADLPAGARYFAIHCNSLYGGMLMIDDVTYETAERELIGYNVYRDGRAVANVGPETLDYSEQAQASGSTYQITAVYSCGESAPCEKASVSSVSLINPMEFDVTAKDGILRIGNSDGRDVRVTAVDGKVIFNGTSRGTTSISAPKGIYIVTIGSKSAKIMME